MWRVCCGRALGGRDDGGGAKRSRATKSARGSAFFLHHAILFRKCGMELLQCGDVDTSSRSGATRVFTHRVNTRLARRRRRRDFNFRPMDWLPMKIAQIAPLMESVPPRLYGG